MAWHRTLCSWKAALQRSWASVYRTDIKASRVPPANRQGPFGQLQDSAWGPQPGQPRLKDSPMGNAQLPSNCVQPVPRELLQDSLCYLAQSYQYQAMHCVTPLCTCSSLPAVSTVFSASRIGRFLCNENRPAKGDARGRPIGQKPGPHETILMRPQNQIIPALQHTLVHPWSCTKLQRLLHSWSLGSVMARPGGPVW